MEMRQYHDHPQYVPESPCHHCLVIDIQHQSTQLAFILNQSQHWYTLRRFGPAEPDHRKDPGHGHWFNLNSSLATPEWVGKLYLSMFLHQAEEEGNGHRFPWYTACLNRSSNRLLDLCSHSGQSSSTSCSPSHTGRSKGIGAARTDFCSLASAALAFYPCHI